MKRIILGKTGCEHYTSHLLALLRPCMIADLQSIEQPTSWRPRSANASLLNPISASYEFNRKLEHRGPADLLNTIRDRSIIVSSRLNCSQDFGGDDSSDAYIAAVQNEDSVSILTMLSKLPRTTAIRQACRSMATVSPLKQRPEGDVRWLDEWTDDRLALYSLL